LIKPTAPIEPKINNEGSTQNIQRENSDKTKTNNPSKILLNENKVKIKFEDNNFKKILCS